MQSRVEQSKPRHLLYLWVIIIAYYSFNAFTQFSVSQTADLDQAEQLILSQTLQPGYRAQPPLYTYLVYLIFNLTGPGLGPLLGLKALLLSAFMGLLIALGNNLNFTMRQHLIAVAGVAFIPQFIWESQRDLTHSVLATTLAAATLLQMARTQRGPALLNYIVLGLLIGLGLISKYNYVLFLTALLMAVIAVPRYRVALANWRILAALLAVLIVALPHLMWMISNYEVATSSSHKIQAGTGNILSGLSHALLPALTFLSPLWIFSILLFSTTSKYRIAEATNTDDGRLLINLLATTMIVVMLFVMLSGAQHIKERWYQPLLFYTPIIIAMFAMSTQAKSSRWYVGMGIASAMLVSVALPVRTLVAEEINELSRPNMPYPSLIQSLSDEVGESAVILAETDLLAGNSRPFFPKSKVFILTYRMRSEALSGKGIVICETPRCENDKFKDWLWRNYAIDTRQLKFNQVEKPYLYAPSKKMVVYWSPVHLLASGKP